jgi:hypothetical protein
MGFLKVIFIFIFDDIEISKKFYPNFVEILMFLFSKILIFISMLKSEFRFRFRLLSVNFDEIEIPTKFHNNSIR